MCGDWLFGEMPTFAFSCEGCLVVEQMMTIICREHRCSMNILTGWMVGSIKCETLTPVTAVLGQPWLRGRAGHHQSPAPPVRMLKYPLTIY